MVSLLTDWSALPNRQPASQKQFDKEQSGGVDRQKGRTAPRPSADLFAEQPSLPVRTTFAIDQLALFASLFVFSFLATTFYHAVTFLMDRLCHFPLCAYL